MHTNEVKNNRTQRVLLVNSTEVTMIATAYRELLKAVMETSMSKTFKLRTPLGFEKNEFMNCHRQLFFLMNQTVLL